MEFRHGLGLGAVEGCDLPEAMSSWISWAAALTSRTSSRVGQSMG
ncbi:hypothetical protein [Streptomyces qinzhouensis]|nr:hypothetical protein [Streptomyces qinzhouensis]